MLIYKHSKQKLPMQEEESSMNILYTLVYKLRKDTRGQDLIEYALMAGFVAVAAGAVMPGIADQISTIFDKIDSLLTDAAAS